MRIGFNFSADSQKGSSKRTLEPLSLAANSIAENARPGAPVGDLQGKTASSTLILTGSAGSRFALGGSGESPTIVRGATALTPGSFAINVRETRPGYGNSPRDTMLTIEVTSVTGAGTLDFSLPENSGLLLLLEEI